MNAASVLSLAPLGFQWETVDPFLFCVHHADAYPRGNAEMGPAASLAGRHIGQDFDPSNGWRMYHGDTVPGFPAHPHRGFETVTVVLKGFVDHSDSHGAAGRYGEGDVQWMTAGSGLQHAEMFPLLEQNADNPLELFQIWLNLPKKSKFVGPHYKMLWSEDIPVLSIPAREGPAVQLRLIAGSADGITAPAPAPDSWAADPANGVAIWIISLEPGTVWTLPAATGDVRRTLYFFEGAALSVDGTVVPPYHAAEVRADSSLQLETGDTRVRILLLQGRPIAEPIAQYGPFVMNTQGEIREAFLDYQRSQFGGWPWDRSDPVQPRERGRFARYADGTEEYPDKR
ncbi:MAG: pirin family protein [Bacteroidetes bacterium]|nr:pirin family protein [Bacteroidota bacterium]